MSTHGELLLQGRGLSKRYGGVVALDNVDFTVRAGETLGLVGPNGAGKTTLVDLITGAQSANEGTLELKGSPIVGPPSKRARMGLARTFQHPLLAGELTIVENLVTGVAARNNTTVLGMLRSLVRGFITGPSWEFSRAATIAEELGISDIERHCEDLSLGEQRLVEVARALAQDPIVMLLDEPFAGADRHGIAGIIEAIRAVQSRGHAVVLVDHNVDLIAQLADRVLLLDKGRVVFEGSAEECLASQEMRDVYFGGGHDE